MGNFLLQVAAAAVVWMLLLGVHGTNAARVINLQPCVFYYLLLLLLIDNIEE
jgi:hypothetical protein